MWASDRYCIIDLMLIPGRFAMFCSLDKGVYIIHRFVIIIFWAYVKESDALWVVCLRLCQILGVIDAIVRKGQETRLRRLE